MASEEIILKPGIVPYSELTKRGLWKQLSKEQQGSFNTYKIGDTLIIDEQNQVYIKKANEATTIAQSIRKNLTEQKERINIPKYNDFLLGYPHSLSGIKIRRLLIQYSSKEKNIERLLKSGKLQQYIHKSILPQIESNKLGYIHYIDTSLQRSFLLSLNNNQLKIIGYVKISTGDKKRNPKIPTFGKDKYWDTPHLIIKMKKGFWCSNPNKGERYSGYGRKGSRVFSLGNYSMKNNIMLSNGNDTDLALAMHKTSPDGEKYLGTKMSHGCIRTSRIMVDILDNLETQNLFTYTIIGDFKNQIIPMIPK